MSEEPTNHEIGRRLDELSRTVHDGFEKMNLRLDRYVLAEVHTLHVQQQQDRVRELTTRIDQIEANRVSGVRVGITQVLSGLALVVSVVIGILAILF